MCIGFNTLRRSAQVVCSVLHRDKQSASGCPVCCVSLPCVWASVEGEEKMGGGGGKGGREGGCLVVGKAHIDLYPPATRQEAAFIILPSK